MVTHGEYQIVPLIDSYQKGAEIIQGKSVVNPYHISYDKSWFFGLTSQMNFPLSTINYLRKKKVS